MSDSKPRERDLVLAPNEFAFLLDETKGHVINYVGPYKTSLANTDQPVKFDPKTKRFIRCDLREAIQTMSIAPEGWYQVLKNPAKNDELPKEGNANSLPQLNVGRKVNIPGPSSFALWPGQMVQVRRGHELRSNQYLVVRVYDDEAAQKNWTEAIIKPRNSGAEKSDTKGEEQSKTPETLGKAPDLTMGKQLVIKGTSVSFYIPPTGVEVVADASGNFVRDAVTLERLEYCILLDENGNKRFVEGPDVVFPEPTEAFVERDGDRKFRAIELSPIKGIYVKVIAPYEDEVNGEKVKYKVGEELFITGNQQMIYYPRPEHAIIRYGDSDITYAIAIPAGEARYVMDRNTGDIKLRKGPDMFLPDPRNEVIVRRVLKQNEVELWFPGNQEAKDVNASLEAMAQEQRSSDLGEFMNYAGGDQPLFSTVYASEASTSGATRLLSRSKFAGDDFKRGTKHTKPRTITLDTKYDGAVGVDVWSGYAVLVVGKSGTREVVQGPTRRLLEYDEVLVPMELNTGTPKSDDRRIKTPFLRILHNKVSDRVEIETKDLVPVSIKLKFRVNFEGEPEKWFDVENYVKFLVDHMRSLLRHTARQIDIQTFYANPIQFVRDNILGVQGEDGSRPGRLFAENGMRIYDVEVLEVTIKDAEISKLLTGEHHDQVRMELKKAASDRRLQISKDEEIVKRALAELLAQSRKLEAEIAQEDLERNHFLTMRQLETGAEAAARSNENAKTTALHNSELVSMRLENERKTWELSEEKSDADLARIIERLNAETHAAKERAEAFSPHLVATLQEFSKRELLGKLAESLSPLAILGGKSIAEVAQRAFQGTPLEGVAKMIDK